MTCISRLTSLTLLDFTRRVGGTPPSFRVVDCSHIRHRNCRHTVRSRYMVVTVIPVWGVPANFFNITDSHLSKGVSFFFPLWTEHDECGSGQHNCDENAICTNTVQGHSCTCKPGYVGNGTICRGRRAARRGRCERPPSLGSPYSPLRWPSTVRAPVPGLSAGKGTGIGEEAVL